MTAPRPITSTINVHVQNSGIKPTLHLLGKFGEGREATYTLGFGSQVSVFVGEPDLVALQAVISDFLSGKVKP